MRNRSSPRSKNAMAPPPSYASAVSRQSWPIIASYVETHDFYSACLVSRQFHKIFAPLLWGEPGRRFGADSDTIYLSITRFKRLLARARVDVRKLSHTLHIPPAQPEFYGGPQAGWLRDILDRLPSLQALIVTNLSFFDHQALQKIHQKNESPTNDDKTYPLRLLTASECENTTAGSLAAALLHFPDLIYLDLSSAQGSRNASVLKTIGTLSQLRVLKLRNCGLRDFDIDLLSLSSRLRSLDVSDNHLTERGISNLIQHLPAACFPLSIQGDEINQDDRHRSQSRPSSKRPSLQSYVFTKLTGGLDGHLYIEDGLPPTFADLYLAGNFLTIEELSKALSYPSIEYLDCGSLNCSQKPQELLSPSSTGSDRRRFSIAEIDKLSPVSFTEAFRNIRSLRIHHSVITSQPFLEKDLPIAEQCFELHCEDLRYELDSTELVSPSMVFELDATSVHNVGEVLDISCARTSENPPAEDYPTFETPDDVGADLSHSSPVDLKNGDAIETMSRPSSSLRKDNGNSVIQKQPPPKISISPNAERAPNLQVQPLGHSVEQSADSQPPHTIIRPTSITVAPAGPETFRYTYKTGEERKWREAGLTPTNPSTIHEIIDEVLQRRHRTEMRERHPGRFKPSMLPNLKTLSLTDVPSTTRRQTVIDSLTMFIQDCAEEEELARLKDLEWQTIHPGQKKAINVSSTSKLQRLILEMTSGPDPVAPPQSPRDNRNSFTKSSTEDPDSEMFMEASESDFSFFGEDDGGLLVGAGRIDPPVAVNDGMIVNHSLYSPTDGGYSMDVISELARFRRERKAKYEAAIKFGGSSIEISLLGHWRGEVKVIKTHLMRN